MAGRREKILESHYGRKRRLSPAGGQGAAEADGRVPEEGGEECRNLDG